MDEWGIFEICIAIVAAGIGSALKMLFTRTDRLDQRVSSLSTRIAVIQERTIEIFHRLERIEEKLDQLLTKTKK